MKLDAEAGVDLALQLRLLGLVTLEHSHELFPAPTVLAQLLLDLVIGAQLSLEYALPFFLLFDLFEDLGDLVPAAADLLNLVARLDHHVLLKALLKVFKCPQHPILIPIAASVAGCCWSAGKFDPQWRVCVGIFRLL